jgi:hypothetical protein
MFKIFLYFWVLNEICLHENVYAFLIKFLVYIVAIHKTIVFNELNPISFSFIEAKIYTYSVRVKFLCDFCAYFVFKVPVFFDIFRKGGIFCEMFKIFFIFLGFK